MRLLTLLFFLFVVIPIIEVALLLQIADQIGGWQTFGLVVVTGVVGSFLARTQGFRVWHQIRQDLRTGKMPTESLADGAMILVAGAFLITPGVLTDAFGFGLLIPAFRRLMRKWLTEYVGASVDIQTHASFGNPFMPHPDEDGDIVDSYVVDAEPNDDAGSDNDGSDNDGSDNDGSDDGQTDQSRGLPE